MHRRSRHNHITTTNYLTVENEDTPPLEPVEVRDLMDELGCGEDQYEMLSRKLTAAREYVEAHCGITTTPTTFDAYFDLHGHLIWPGGGGYGWCPAVFELPCRPVTSVLSVKYLDTDGDEQTLDPSSYILVKDSHSYSIIQPTPGQNWPSVFDVPTSVTVRFIAGYTDVPDKVLQAIYSLAAHFYENREPVVVGSIVAKLPYSFEAILNQLRLPEV